MKCRVPAAVVEVEMRVDDDVHLIRLNSGRSERRRQKLLVAVDLAHLCWLLVADPGLNQHRLLPGAHDNGVEPQQDAVLVVGWGALLPERLWHYAKHGSAVEVVGAIGADGQFEVTNMRARPNEICVSGHRYPHSHRNVRGTQSSAGPRSLCSLR